MQLASPRRSARSPARPQRFVAGPASGKKPAATRPSPVAKPSPSALLSQTAKAVVPLEHQLYCRGRHKPLFRGVFHASAAMCSPVWSAYLLSLCRTSGAYATAALVCVGATACLGLSGLYHRGEWALRTELLMGKLDFVGIHLQVAFSMAPFYLLLLPESTGWAVIGALGGCAGFGVWLTFSGLQVGRHAMTFVYIATAFVQLVPMTSSALSGRSVFSRVSEHERALMAVAAFCYLGGSQIYALKKPDPWHHALGYHELWHLCVVAASIATYLCNVSLLTRLDGGLLRV